MVIRLPLQGGQHSGVALGRCSGRGAFALSEAVCTFDRLVRLDRCWAYDSVKTKSLRGIAFTTHLGYSNRAAVPTPDDRKQS